MFPWVLTLPIPALHEDGIAKKIILDIGDQLLSELHGVMAGGNDILSLLVNESALTKDQMLQNVSPQIQINSTAQVSPDSSFMYE